MVTRNQHYTKTIPNIYFIKAEYNSCYDLFENLLKK